MKTDQRINVSAQILAGFCSNPSIFAENSQYGWSLVNATDDDLAGYAVFLADKLIEAAAKTTP